MFEKNVLQSGNEDNEYNGKSIEDKGSNGSSDGISVHCEDIGEVRDAGGELNDATIDVTNIGAEEDMETKEWIRVIWPIKKLNMIPIR
ncbi:hypothetical protein Tco_0442251, partial [Tanacetum coccineum]